MDEQDETATIDTDAVIDAWFVERIHNSPASRDVVVINLLTEAKEDLKRRLRPEATPASGEEE